MSERVLLIDAISYFGEKYVMDEISSFSSPINPDVEFFLKNSAIEFAKQNIAPTTLVYSNDGIDWRLCGFFTLTIKTVTLRKNQVGSNMFKKVKKFGTYEKESDSCTLPIPLIAQLGKNYSDGCNELIKGSELLKYACDEVRKAQSIIGGKSVYLECEDTPKLIGFYRDNGFREFSQRPLDPDELDDFVGDHLVQMIRYFG